MSKEFSKPFYNSKAWQACRRAYISRRRAIDGGMCEICHKSLGYILHHKITLTPMNITNPDIALNHCNLQYVCRECHDGLEGHFLGRQRAKLLCGFDGDGQPVPCNLGGE